MLKCKLNRVHFNAMDKLNTYCLKSLRIYQLYIVQHSSNVLPT
jgi:hypothetical protein